MNSEIEKRFERIRTELEELEKLVREESALSVPSSLKKESLQPQESIKNNLVSEKIITPLSANQTNDSVPVVELRESLTEQESGSELADEEADTESGSPIFWRVAFVVISLIGCFLYASKRQGVEPAKVFMALVTSYSDNAMGVVTWLMEAFAPVIAPVIIGLIAMAFKKSFYTYYFPWQLIFTIGVYALLFINE